MAGDAFGEFAVEHRAGGEVELAARRFGDELFGEEALAAAGAAGDQDNSIRHDAALHFQIQPHTIQCFLFVLVSQEFLLSIFPVAWNCPLISK